MAQVAEEHIQPLTLGFVVLLTASLGLIAILNHFADK